MLRFVTHGPRLIPDSPPTVVVGVGGQVAGVGRALYGYATAYGVGVGVATVAALPWLIVDAALAGYGYYMAYESCT